VGGRPGKNDLERKENKGKSSTGYPLPKGRATAGPQPRCSVPRSNSPNALVPDSVAVGSLHLCKERVQAFRHRRVRKNGVRDDGDWWDRRPCPQVGENPIDSSSQVRPPFQLSLVSLSFGPTMDVTPIVTSDARKNTPIEANDFHRVPVSPGPHIKKSETTTAPSTQTIQIVKHTIVIALKFKFLPSNPACRDEAVAKHGRSCLIQTIQSNPIPSTLPFNRIQDNFRSAQGRIVQLESECQIQVNWRLRCGKSRYLKRLMSRALSRWLRSANSSRKRIKS
jgi:hypothetical protein